MKHDEVTYLERLPFFTDCYDTTNPLTQREGRLRMIQAEIDRVGEDPEQAEKVEALKAQQESVSSQDRMQALQAYSMAAQAR
jgi:uncharacterized membrane-anchored protein YjiN (DUF445 family)